MNTLMWDHPITSEHVERLVNLGYTHVPPIKKTLACKDTGEIQTITTASAYVKQISEINTIMLKSALLLAVLAF